MLPEVISGFNNNSLGKTPQNETCRFLKFLHQSLFNFRIKFLKPLNRQFQIFCFKQLFLTSTWFQPELAIFPSEPFIWARAWEAGWGCAELKLELEPEGCNFWWEDFEAQSLPRELIRLAVSFFLMKYFASNKSLRKKNWYLFNNRWVLDG